jgi:enoyl-CoA hydratase/carnithine racemase
MESSRLTVLSRHLSAQPIVLLHKIEGKIAVVTLNRPNKFNPINRETITELTRILAMLDRDPHIHVIVLTGAGKGFSSGTDLKRFRDELHVEMQSGGNLENYWEALRNAKKPLIAAVNGSAYGDGMELALMCDIIIAHESARFSLDGIRANVVSGSYALQTLTKTLGKQRTSDLMFTGRRLQATEAAKFGLCRTVKSNVLGAAVDTAKKLAVRDVALLIQGKSAVKQAFETFLSAGTACEHDLQKASFGLQGSVLTSPHLFPR